MHTSIILSDFILQASTFSLTRLLYFAGILQLTLLLASALVPSTLNWKSHLAPLPPLLRHLIWVHGAFIVLTIIGFALLTLLNAPALAAATPLARTLSAFIALFWLARLAIQLFLFDAKPYLTTPLLKFGYHALTLTFLYLSATYSAAALA